MGLVSSLILKLLNSCNFWLFKSIHGGHREGKMGFG